MTAHVLSLCNQALPPFADLLYAGVCDAQVCAQIPRHEGTLARGTIMIFQGRSRVRLTQSELNTLRRRNAQNGSIVNEIDTADDLLKAVIGGLSSERATDLLEFLETGSSPMTRSSKGTAP